MIFSTLFSKARKAGSFFALAVRKGALPEFFEFLIYRSPFGSAWARSRGYRFHRSSMIWLVESDRIHTRAVFLLPRLKLDYPGIRSAGIELELHDLAGKKIASEVLKDVSVDRPLVIRSEDLPGALAGRAPREGLLVVKLTLGVPDAAVWKRDGLFNATHTYIDYWREGDFVTTLHDYAAFLPDQPLSVSSLGMIPAYCDEAKETFLVYPASCYGARENDLEVILMNARGEKRSAPLGALKSFATRRAAISEFLPDAARFLGGQPGQIIVSGLFRGTMTRLAYGIRDRKTGSFSLDHCYYSESPDRRKLSAEQRSRVAKGDFNPFVVIEDDQTTTSALFFHLSKRAPLDLIIYDAAGKQAARISPLPTASSPVAPLRIDIGQVLRERGVTAPFVGHAEVLYTEDPSRPVYDRDLALCVEYCRGGRYATVIFSADIWNAPKRVPNPSYRSVCRVICDDAQTTQIAISNVSYAYDYDLEVPFTLSLVSNGDIVATRRFSIGPHATMLEPIEFFFPDAKRLLAPSGGVGYTTTTDINVLCLTHLFFTEDRKSRAWSVEHSLDV